MRAISLWQPWASLIMTGAKTFETRGWETKYRGPLVIHASKGGLAKWEELDMIESQAFGGCWEFQGALAPLIGKPLEIGKRMYRGEWPGVKRSDLPRGAALGMVNLIDCRRTEDLTQGEIAKELAFGNYGPGRFAWKLELIGQFVEPVPVKGSQGFFNLDMCCPSCSSPIIYRDRVDAQRDVAHCDDCGEEMTGDVYRLITSREAA
jgi:activating signal cointegrator 1